MKTLLSLLLLVSYPLLAVETFPRIISSNGEKICLIVKDDGELFACSIDNQCEEYPQCSVQLKKLSR